MSSGPMAFITANGGSCLLKRPNLSRQKTRPSHPKGNPAAQTAFKKKLPSELQALATEHPEARLQLWC
ncbi:winged helix-turn-helix domain-containing protein [Microvirga aerilata]|uniref:winged helix-turn-helix domain-containing protein n=1 Tax=Microvirga aerilata TaxID=670292 RepID=UPI0036370C6C